MTLSHLNEHTGHVETLSHSCPFPDDPLAVFERLTEKSPYGVLLESAEISSKHAEKSMLVIDAALRLVCWGHQVRVEALTPNGVSLLELFEKEPEAQRDGRTVVLHYASPTGPMDEISRLKAASPFDALRVILKKIKALRDEKNAVFLAGVIAYDYLETFEKLPGVKTGANNCPDYLFYLAETLMEIDHKKSNARLIGAVFSGKNVQQAYFSVSQRLESLSAAVKDARLRKISAPEIDGPVTVDVDDARFGTYVERMRAHIKAGDIYQVVPSRTFHIPCPHPMAAYARLKKDNPSPYMFYLKDAAFTLFGASPESALKYDAATGQAELYPIAGTRRRGMDEHGVPDPDLDGRIELNLRNDEKEKAEHIMLVDLARNDMARIARPNTRYVADLMRVDRYSHVMHLVSRVVGQLREDLDALHAYQACMNMGTLTGAPKIRAAELIREVEGVRRGSYGGAVGYLTGTGDMDTCIVIRSAFVRDGMAHIQAGAGVVLDSDPQAEADETRGKAQAVINAIRKAHHEQT